MASSAVLGTGPRAVAQPAADANARQWLETVSNAMGQPGRVFRTQIAISEKSPAGESASTATAIIDAEQKKSRFELRRDNTLIGVTAVDNWEVAAFDAINNRVTAISVPDDMRGQVRNPAFSVLAPSLIAAYQAGQINPDESVNTSMDQVAGRQATKLTLTLSINQQVPAAPPQGQPSGGQQAPAQPQMPSVTINQEYTLYLDQNGGMPIQEMVRTTDGSGTELSARTATYEGPTLVDRSSLAAETLSLQAVRGMVATMDQQVERARQIGFPLYWLGREFGRAFTDAKGQRQTGLVLNDVRVLSQPGAARVVVLQYGTRDEPAVPYVVITGQARSDWDQFLQQTQGQLWFQHSSAQRQQVQVPGGAQGTLHQIQPPASSPGGTGGTGGRPAAGGAGAAQPPMPLPPLMMVQINAGDGVLVLDTPPLMTQEGRQVNPFLDQTQIAALAGALSQMR